MIGSGHCLSVNAENLTTIFVLSGIFCFCVYPVSSNYTVCKRFYGRTPPPPNGGPPRTERSPLPCGHLPTPWGVTPKGEALLHLGSPLGELSPQVTEGLPATAANRFHKELRFFFSLLKRKKEAKKEKSSRSTCTTRSNITRRLHRESSTDVKSFV